MGRCIKCALCTLVLQFRAKHKKNSKKVKKFEYKSPCSSPTEKKLKHKALEMEQLFDSGHGGQIRGEFNATEETALNPAARDARPKGGLEEEQSFDPATFDEYCKIVRQCTDVVAYSLSRDVMTESRSMIPKMRGLLHPSVKSEVDYAEVTKDTSNILAKWLDGNAAGTSAFVPDIEFREQCYAALKIFSCAGEEAKQIPLEYIDMFEEDDGIGMYNQLVEIIGEQEKKCLPLVNICLCA